MFSYHALAQMCSSAISPGCADSAPVAGATNYQKDDDSGTNAARYPGNGEQVGVFEIFQGLLAARVPARKQTGELKTASHSGPHMRSRMEVRSKKVWMPSGCCSSTSSSR